MTGGAPAKLEKKPVKFSNLLCEHVRPIGGFLLMCWFLVGAGLNMFE